MASEQLASALLVMYEGAKTGEKTAKVLLFGIVYAEAIRDSGASVETIVGMSGLPPSYVGQVRSGMALSEYVLPLV